MHEFNELTNTINRTPRSLCGHKSKNCALTLSYFVYCEKNNHQIIKKKFIHSLEVHL